MSDTINILQAAPLFEARRETVPAPELGGHVIVRGLMASEAFALAVQREQALAPVHTARAEHEARVRELQAVHADRVRALPSGTQAPAFVPPEFVPPQLSVADLRAYGRYSSELLALAVVNSAGLGLYTADQWELMTQHHPALRARLEAVAERLSGLAREGVEKN